MPKRHSHPFASVRNIFAVYIIFLALLPTGTIHGFNVKILVFIPLALGATMRIAREDNGLSQLAFAALVIASVIAWTMPSVINPFYATYALSQAKDVLTTLAGCLFVRVFVRSTEDAGRFIRLCIYTVCSGCLVKILLLSYSFWTGASVTYIVDAISNIFGIKLMSMDLDGVGGRLQLPSDNLLPIVLFATIGLRQRLRIRPLAAVISVALIISSSLYTFSRFIWVSTLLGALLGIFIARRDQLVLAYAACVTGVTVYLFPMLSALVTLRFSAALAGPSDVVRTWQIAALRKFFWEAPFFGHGMGSYVLSHKRSVDTPYAYEVQIAALFGQFGVIGVSLLLGLLVNYYRKAFDFQRARILHQIAVILLLVDFIGAAMFNPDLIASMSAVSYGLIFVLARTDPKTQSSERSTTSRSETDGQMGFPWPRGAARSLTTAGVHDQERAQGMLARS